MFIMVAGALVLGVALTWFLTFRGDKDVTIPATPSVPDVVKVLDNLSDAPAQDDVVSLMDLAILARESGQLIAPQDASALYYFEQVLALDPDNEQARQGSAAVMEEASQAVRNALERDRVSDAVRELDKLRTVAPNHLQVTQLDSTLADLHSRYLDQSRQLIQEKNFERAGSALEIAALIPQGDLAELDKVRGELEQARLSEVKRSTSASAESAETLAGGDEKPKPKPADQAKEFIAAAELRIVQGQLVEPAGDSAKFFLEKASAAKADHPLIEPAKASLGDAMAARAETSLAKDDFDSLDAWIGELTALGASEEVIQDLQQRAEVRQIELESARLIPVAEMKVAEYVPPKYPERAERKNIQGWVDVEFTVTRDGETRDITVMDADPKGVFEAASRKAISRWRFEPREYRGQLIDQRVFVRVNFTF